MGRGKKQRTEILRLTTIASRSYDRAMNTLKDGILTEWKSEPNDSEKNVWKYYINGKEVDSSRAVDRNGWLRFPFQGAKKGDMCISRVQS